MENHSFCGAEALFGSLQFCLQKEHARSTFWQREKKTTKRDVRVSRKSGLTYEAQPDAHGMSNDHGPSCTRESNHFSFM